MSGVLPGDVQTPAVARVITMCLMMMTVIILAFCMTRRLSGLRDWRRLQVPQWLVLAIYTDSLLFILTTAVLTKSFNMNGDQRICEGAVLLCLICYMSTKVLLYYFLVEKVYVIRNPWLSRLKDKLYLFNVLGAICPYLGLVILCFIYRTAYVNSSGRCVIGISRNILLALVSFEILLNVYLTSLFLHPLKKLYGGESTKNAQNAAKAALKTMAMRTFIGSCATLVSTSVNLSVLAALEGEKGWLCLMLCNLDILFPVAVLHWATSLDKSMERTEDAYTTKQGAMEERTVRAESTVSQTLFRNLGRVASTSGTQNGGNSRKASVALTWEDMELNEIEFDTKLGGIREETRDVSDAV